MSSSSRDVHRSATSPSHTRYFTNNPASQRSEHSVERIVKSIRPKLKESMRQQNDPNKTFITNLDLNNVWPDDMLLFIMNGTAWSHLKPGDIRASFKKILSILVWINARTQLTRFVETFSDVPSGAAIKSDRDLPFKREDLQFMEKHVENVDLFWEVQSRFCPFVIKIPSPQGIQNVDIRNRLPINDPVEFIGRGAYGVVEKVRIPPGHIQWNISGGAEPSSDDRVFACKRIVTGQKDFDWEAKKLSVLKACLVGCRNVMVHDALIRHGNELLILFPYAKHRDLQVFLNEGFDTDGKQVYEFEGRFKQASDRPKLIRGLLVQLLNIANAIHWLHYEVKTPDGESIRIAHMDLKPDNILVAQEDPGSPGTEGLPVGFWRLSDFGIAVDDTKQNMKRQDLLTIGQFTATMNTRPRRVPGAHQAPEVELLGHILGQRDRLKFEEKGVGRRSDIWSFGCIFLEVLAFALGKRQEVEELSNARNAGSDDDKFYWRSSQNTSRGDTTTFEFEVKDGVLRWLRELPDRYVFPGKWLNCASQIGERILQVDAASRPNAARLSKLMSESSQHWQNSTQGGPIQCPILTQQTPPKRSSASYTIRSGRGMLLQGRATESPQLRQHQSLEESARGNAAPPAQIRLLRSSTVDEELLGDYNISQQGPNHARVDSANHQTLHSLGTEQTSPQGVLVSSELSEGRLSWDVRREDFEDSETSEVQTVASSATVASPIHGVDDLQTRFGTDLRNGLDQSRRLRSAHGLLINPDKERRPLISSTLRLDQYLKHKMTVEHLALSPCGTMLAFVARNGKKHSIYAFQIFPFECTSSQQGAPIPLLDGCSYDGIAISGSFVAAWGFSKQDSFVTVRLLDLQDRNNTPSPPMHDEIRSLKMVAVSCQGAVAYVCDDRVILSPLRTYTPVHLTGQYGDRRQSEKTFVSAAFNDNGEFLYAWAYDDGQDYFYAWRVHDTEELPKPDSEASYKSDKKGKPDSKIIPYNTILGGIIEKAGKRFFPGHSRSSQIGRGEPLFPNFEILPDVVSSCVYGDHSLVTVEVGATQMHGRIREYRIVQSGSHALDTEYKEICILTTRPSTNIRKRSEVRVVVRDGQICIVVCNPNTTVEIVQLSAS